MSKNFFNAILIDNLTKEMLDPYIGKAAFQLGFYIAFTAGVLLLFLEKGTAEYVITQFTLAIGIIFIVLIGILVRIGGRNDGR